MTMVQRWIAQARVSYYSHNLSFIPVSASENLFKKAKWSKDFISISVPLLKGTFISTLKKSISDA